MATIALSRRRSVTCMLTCCCWCMLWCTVSRVAASKDTSNNRRCTSEEMLHKREGKVCGSQIPILVNMTCRSFGLGVYNPKSGTSCRRSRGVRSTLEGSGSGDEIFLGRMAALSMLRATKRSYDSLGGAYHTGIVCECCVNRCSMRELQAYCSPKCPSTPSTGGLGPVAMTSSASSSSAKMKRRGGGRGGKKSAGAGGVSGVIDVGQGHGHHRQHTPPPPHGIGHHQHSAVVAAGGEFNGEDGEGGEVAAEEMRLIRNARPVSHTSHLSTAAASGQHADDVIGELLLTTT